MMLKSFLPRAICVFVIIQGPIWMIADVLAPYTSSFAYESIADKVANDLANDKSAKAKHGGDIPQHYNVAWLHLTDKNKKVAVSNRPSGLPEHDSSAQSRVLDIKGSRFVEIVRALDKDEMLAVGFRCPSLMDSLFSKGVWPGQLPVGTLLLGTILNGLALGTAYLLFLGIPLSKTIKQVGEGKDLPETFPPMVSSELPTIVKAVKDRFSNLQQEHDRSISAARTDLSGAFVKEVEDKFISKLAKDIVSLQSSEAVCNLIMHRVADEFIGTVKAAYGIEFPNGGQYKLVDNLGFSEEQAKLLGTLAEGGFINLIKKFSSPMFLNRDEMADKRLDSLSGELGCDQCLVIPIEFGGVVRAHLCFFIVTKDQTNTQKLERIAKQISDQLAPLWHVISNYEQAHYLSRHDHLTGVKNRICMEDLMQTLRAKPKAAEGVETVFLLFEGDNFRVMLNTYGPKAIDKLISELGQELLASLEKTQRFKRSATKVSYADRLFRVGGCKFMLILEDANTKKAIELAENVEKSIGEKKGWANGMPSWSLSCAVASMDKDNSTPDSTFEEAMITMEYLRSRKSVATVMLSKDVSQEFMSRAKTRNSGGTSSLFEPTQLLATMAKGQKTGILTVTSQDGRIFWSSLEDGNPVKARLGKLCGDSAVVEFISSFADGTYTLQDLSSVDSHTAEEMKNLGIIYGIHTPMSELIQFSIMVREAAIDAKVLLKTPELVVHPLAERQVGLIEKLHFKSGKPVNKLMLDVTNQVWDLSQGRFTLEEILSKTEDAPAALVWTAAAFLMQNKAIKFSRLRVSAHTEPSEPGVSPTGVKLPATPPSASTGYVSAPRACSACRTVDPLSQKYCVHCGCEMVAVAE